MDAQQYAVIVECTSNGLFYIPEARSRGLKPLVIYPPLPPSGFSSMRSHARESLDADVVVFDAPEDMDELVEMLKPYSIACVFAGSDFGVVMADQLASRLGLPGNDPATSSCRLEKPAMQESLEQAGIRAIRSRQVSSLGEALEFWRELDVKRVVLKPVASCGTQGVHFCSSKEEISRYLEELLSEEDFYGRKNSSVLMQEYIDGTEYIVNTVSCKGTHRVTDIWMYHKVPIGSEGNAYDYARLITRLDAGHRDLVTYAYKALDAMGYQYGPSHGEYMIDEKGPVLIEAGARPMGGGFSMELLDACVGHHLTDCAMDSYLEPERFEQARQTPYQPAMEMMIKYFIVPEVQAADQIPALSFLKHLECLRRVNMNQVLEHKKLEKTVNLVSSPGFLQLCHSDPLILTRDYQIIRRIERQYFHLLFHEGVGEYRSLDKKEALDVYCSLPAGTRFMLLEDPELCREIQQDGVMAVTPETLPSLPSGCSGVVFAPSSTLGLEECLDLLSASVKKLCPGGAVKILERSYAGFPYGTAGYEILLGLLGAGIQMPMCGQPSILTGTAGGVRRIAPGEMIQTDWFTRVRDDQWLLPERRAEQEGVEIGACLHIAPGTRVFDCPCGDARISYQLALCGAKVTGMDINPRFVEQAKERFRAMGLSGTFTVGDMRAASYPGGCDLLLNWFNSFGYFSEEENRCHMKTMADCIRPGGTLILEGPNLNRVRENTEKKYQENEALVRQEWDEETRRMNITYPPEKGQEAVVVSIRIYSLEEYKELLSLAGLVLEQVYGEHFKPYSPDSMRMILIARKPDSVLSCRASV